MFKVKKPKKIQRKVAQEPYEGNLQEEQKADLELWPDLEHNMAVMKGRLGGSPDIVFHEFLIGLEEIRACLVYTDGLVDRSVVSQDIMGALQVGIPLLEAETGRELLLEDLIKRLRTRAIQSGEIKKEKRFKDLFGAALAGGVVLLVDGCTEALIVSAPGWPSRGIDEPATEVLIRGPRDGFSETLRFNTALLRRRIKDPGFRIESMKLGERSQTEVALCYIYDIVSLDVLREVRRRLEKINIDAILEGGYVEQLIEDSYWSPFPQVQYTERPDKAAAAVLEGRVVILVDTTPFALIVPATFVQFFQSPEDYYERWIIGSLTRLTRYIASYMAVFIPGLYVAAVAYHPGLIPIKLGLAIAASREGVPFPIFVEVLLMEAAFEFLREAGARLPKAIGHTIGIVGGLIIGEAAVRANITSPIMVIMVATTAIASFAIPSYSLGIGFRMLRFPTIFLAGILGIYGVVLSFILINIHMVTLKSFGINYMSPFTPYLYNDWKDLMVRLPWRALITRPVYTKPQDLVRQRVSREDGGFREKDDR